MTGFQGVRLVALRELRERGKSKAYLISTVFTVIILVGAIVVPGLISGGPEEYEIGLVGEGGEEVVATATEIANRDLTEGEEPDAFDTTRFDSAEEAEAAIDEGTIEAALVGTEEIIVSGFGGFGGGEGPSSVSRLQEAASTIRVQELVAEDESAAEVISILGSEPLEVRDISGDDGSNQGTRGAIAFFGLILMYIAVLTYGTWMLSGVTEEKTNRVVEVLLSTLKPWQIFTGKLIGIGTLGVGQMVLLIAVALVGLQFQDALEIPTLPVDSVVALVVWFVIGFLLYATLFGAAGSLVSRMEDAQSAAAPLSILAVVGYLFAFTALNDPAGTWAIIGTFVPFTAPYVAPIRLALQDIAAWEMALAGAIAVATIVVMVRLAGRVYAGGLLRFGGRVKWLEAFRAGE